MLVGRTSMWSFVVGACLGAPAWAQASDEVPAGTDPPTDTAGTSRASSSARSAREPIETFQRDFAWQPAGPLRFVDVTGVAIAPGAKPARLAVTRSGAVWAQAGGEDRWRRVLVALEGELGKLSQDEDIRLSTEARLEELLEDGDDPADVDELDQAVESGGDDGALDAAAGELPADRMSDPLLAFQASDGRGLIPRVWIDGSRWILSRADGLRVSDDQGESWRRVLVEPVSSWVSGPDGRHVVGTARGVLWEDEDGVFRAAEVPTRTLVWDVTASEGHLWAATEAGLWWSEDGQRWTRRGELEGRLTAVTVDPGDERVVWVATPTSVMMSDDGGQDFVAPMGPPLPGVRDVQVHPDGLLLAAADDGVWESRDGGASWSPLERGLSDQRATSIAMDRMMPWAATSDGLYKVVPYIGVAEEEGGEDWLDVGELLVAASMRNGMRPGRQSLGIGGQVLGYLLPQASLRVFRVLNRDTVSQLDAGLTRDFDEDLGIWLNLTWRRPGNDLASTGVFVVDDGDQLGVYSGVLEDRVLMGRVSRRVTNDTSKTAHQITAMYYNRKRLVMERDAGVPGRSLLDAVHLELRIAEVEAWLDLLTDGAVSRYRKVNARGATPVAGGGG